MDDGHLRFGKIRVRPTQEVDLDYILRVEEDPETAGSISPWTRARHLEALDDPETIHWILLPAGEDRPVGFLILSGISNHDDCLELVRLVVSERGKGFGREAVRLVKQEAFDRFRAHRLWLGLLVENEGGMSLCRSEGFLVDGVLRDRLRDGDGYRSLVVMSILEKEYRNPGG